MSRTPLLTILLSVLMLALLPTAGGAMTSHAGWPKIDGDLIMHKADESGMIVAIEPDRHNELLGGHGSDTIVGGDGGDVIWGDYKEGGQPTSQTDVIRAGSGRDFIYASHGRNDIDAGAGNDWIKAHYGHGTIDCGPGRDLLYLSGPARGHYKVRNCETVSHKTLGY